jgi:diguanylate cyclase (GGDEF)-like protein
MERDPLTGLGTRKGFFARGDELVAAGDAFALAVMNIDHFKRFNMHNGHVVGDEVLKAVALQLRNLDAFRVGGDTFGVFLRTDSDAEKIRRNVAEEVNPTQPVHCGDAHCMGPQPPPRVSIGVSAWRGESMTELFERTAAAMVEAKTNGRNTVVVG